LQGAQKIPRLLQTEIVISSFPVIASETWFSHSFVSLRAKRGNLIKKEQNSLCAKRARTGGWFSGEKREV